jgi:BlaI family transcriptional regulator, penicillinase repressor
MRNDAPRISAAESVVMDALWRESPLSAEEITAQVAAPQGWTLATVKTLINRLLKKAAIGAEPQGRRYLYRPLVSRGDYLHQESRSLLDRLYGGRIAPFVTQLSEREPLSRDEIDELKRLIERLERDD